MESEHCFHWIVYSYTSDYDSDSVASENQPLLDKASALSTDVSAKRKLHALHGIQLALCFALAEQCCHVDLLLIFIMILTF